jgi:hypothetical protein
MRTSPSALPSGTFVREEPGVPIDAIVSALVEGC